MKKEEKSKWQLKRERLVANPTYYLMMRRIENGPLYERIAFMKVKKPSAR